MCPTVFNNRPSLTKGDLYVYRMNVEYLTSEDYMILTNVVNAVTY